MQSGQLASHMADECELRLWSCVCGAQAIYNERNIHLIVDCPMKLGACPQGCGLSLPRDQVGLITGLRTIPPLILLVTLVTVCRAIFALITMQMS